MREEIYSSLDDELQLHSEVMHLLYEFRKDYLSRVLFIIMFQSPHYSLLLI